MSVLQKILCALFVATSLMAYTTMVNAADVKCKETVFLDVKNHSADELSYSLSLFDGTTIDSNESQAGKIIPFGSLDVRLCSNNNAGHIDTGVEIKTADGKPVFDGRLAYSTAGNNVSWIDAFGNNYDVYANTPSKRNASISIFPKHK